VILQLRTVFGSRNGQTITIGQLRQLIIKNNTGNNDNSGSRTVSMAEVEEAVRELESENLVQYVERTQTVIIRSMQP
jgi:hypothetical protein